MQISVRDIEFSYNGSPVLQNIRCEISGGDFIAIVGPNGSGKSTLIKCMNGILSPRKGSIHIGEQNIRQHSLRHLARTMAYVPQKNAGHTPATVFDTVLLGRKPYINWKPSASDMEVASRIIAELGLEEIASKDINKLSGGQQQTVFIARALAQEPEIMLLDEPTANLDLRHTLEIMNMLQELCNKGLTVVIALHDINLAMRYATGIMMLKEGEIYAWGGKEIITEEILEELYDIRVQITENKAGVHVVPVGLK